MGADPRRWRANWLAAASLIGTDAFLIQLFATNPFYVLAVRATTDQRALRRILEERAIQLQLGMHPQGLSEESLRVFRQVLERPEQRVVAELFGLHAVDPGLPAEQLPELRERAQSASGLERALLVHDVAVTSSFLWSLWPPESREGAEALRISMAAWRSVLRDKEFWSYLASRSENSLTPEALWQKCAQELVSSAAEVSAALLETHQLGPALGLVSALRDSALPGDTVEAAVREITRGTRAEMRFAIQRISARTEGGVADVSADEVELVNEVLGPYRRLTLLGVSIGDEDAAGNAVSEVAVRVYTRAKDPFVTVALLDAGLGAISSPRLVSSFASERATALRLHHQERAVTAWQANQWPAAAAHATLAADVSDREESERFRGLAERASASSSAADVAAWVARAQGPFEAERLATSRRVEAAAHFQVWSGADRSYVDPAALDFSGRATPVTRAPSTPNAPPSGVRAAASSTKASGDNWHWLLIGIAGAVVVAIWAATARPSGSSVANPTATPFATSRSAASTTAPPSAATTTPPLVVSRLVTLAPEQMIMPPNELPLAGFTVSLDKSVGSKAWERRFSSTSGDYYEVSFRLVVYSSGTATSGIASTTCDFTFTGAARVTAREVSATVIGDGAKACRYTFDDGALDWNEYITSTRNVLVIVAGEARRQSISTTESMNQMIALARQQIAIIDRVSPASR